jgi:hypothetical protein
MGQDTSSSREKEESDLSRFSGFLWGKVILVFITYLGEENSGFYDSVQKEKGGQKRTLCLRLLPVSFSSKYLVTA